MTHKRHQHKNNFKVITKNEKIDLETCRKSIENIIPTPKALPQKRQNRKRQNTLVLTSTPNLEEIKTKAEEKRLILERRAKRQRVTKNLAETETQIDIDSQESDEEDPYSNIEDDSDATCIYCNDLYTHTKPGDIWFCCQNCKKWAHAECAGIAPKTKNFICELCC